MREDPSKVTRGCRLGVALGAGVEEGDSVPGEVGRALVVSKGVEEGSEVLAGRVVVAGWGVWGIAVGERVVAGSGAAVCGVVVGLGVTVRCGAVVEYVVAVGCGLVEGSGDPEVPTAAAASRSGVVSHPGVPSSCAEGSDTSSRRRAGVRLGVVEEGRPEAGAEVPGWTDAGSDVGCGP